MRTELQERIFNNLNSRDTEYLKDIWQNSTPLDWEEDSIEIIKEILIDRLGYLPPQSFEIKNSLRNKTVEELEKVEIPDESLKNDELVTEHNYDLAIGYYNQGLTNCKRGELEESISDFQKAISLLPENEDIWESLLDVETKIEKIFLDSETKVQMDEALDLAYNDEIYMCLEICENVKPKLPIIAIAQNYLGLIYQTAGQIDAAITAYKNAIQFNPRFYPARENLANAQIQWEEEQYHLYTYAEPVDLEETDLSLDASSFQENDDPIPQWMYMDEASYHLIGWPGHRNRQGRIGLDPLDRNAEEGHMIGRITRLLMNRNFRTRNPIYLFLMFIWGMFFILAGVIPLILGHSLGIILAINFLPYIFLGILLLINVISSIQNISSDQNDEQPNAFY